MNKKVCVRIKGLQAYDESASDEEVIETINIGAYYKRDGKHFIKYESAPEDSEKKPNSNLLKISPDEVELTVKGEIWTHLLFTRGEKNTTMYDTPFGSLSLGIDTYELDVSESEDLIVVDIKYGVDFNLNSVALSTVHIEIESTQ